MIYIIQIVIVNLVYLHFEEAEYTFGEEDESLEVVLVLNKEVTTNVTIQIMNINNAATGEYVGLSINVQLHM